MFKRLAKKHSDGASNTNPSTFPLKDMKFLAVATGTFSKVYTVESGSVKCVLKVMGKEAKRREKIIQECKIVKELKHISIAKLHFAFQTVKFACLLFEVAGDWELFELIHERNYCFNGKVLTQTVAQMHDALCYLHEKSLMHRDLKPENIMLSANGRVKLIDFGFSIHAPDGFAKTCLGSPSYIAPEIFQAKTYGFSVDWWAFGVILYEIFTSEQLFPHDNRTVAQIKEDVLAREVTFQHTRLNSAMKTILARYINRNASQRYGHCRHGLKDLGMFKKINWEKIRSGSYQLESIDVAAISVEEKEAKTVDLDVEGLFSSVEQVDIWDEFIQYKSADELPDLDL